MIPSDKPITRTWDEFWGPLLMVRFHKDHPARWTVREQRAAWIFEEQGLRAGARVLDIGCGDGLLDICLARLGAKVTAVDRIASVLVAAATEPDAELVDFISGDIREIEFASHAFDLVLMLDIIGLLGRRDEARIIRRVADWLGEDGRLVIDCPHEPDESDMESKREMDGGVLRIRSTYDQRTRQLHMRPRFHDPSGDTIELRDCYADPTDQRLGIVRHLYPKRELTEFLCAAGLDAAESHRSDSKGIYTLVATRHTSDQ